MGKGSGGTRKGSANNPKGLSGGGAPKSYREAVQREVDDYYGFESNGDFVNWPAKMSMDGDKEISDLIDNFTDYFVESQGGDYANVGHGRDIKLASTFDVLPKGTPDGDEDLFRKTIKVDENTTIGDIFKKLGYRSRKDQQY